MDNRLHTPENSALRTIRHEWVRCMGAVTVAILMSLWVTPLWMPAVDILLALALIFFNPGRNLSPTHPCGRLTGLTVYTLVISGIISLGINVAYHTELIRYIFDVEGLNVSIPYITSLVIFPVLTILSWLAVSRPGSRRHVRTCHLQSEYNPAQPLLGRVVHGVYRSMLRCLAWLATFVCIVDWTYYFICYKNESLNTPDRFFFFVVPAAAYLWSLFYVHRAYSAIVLANGLKLSDVTSTLRTVTDSAILRFLVVHRGRLLLDVSPAVMSACAVDTPVTSVKSPAFRGDEASARVDFESASGVTDFNLRLLYTTSNPAANNRIYHYLVTIPDDDSTGRLSGQWTTLDEIDRLLRSGLLAPRLGAEIFRIYTITMAWKTYDERGQRRYPIRNYRPTFRLADIDKWKVDYNDVHWLRVARINQDAIFYRLRRLFL